MQVDLRAVWPDQQELRRSIELLGGSCLSAARPAVSHSKSRPRSIALAECVSGPAEIQSTPVSAMARAEDRFTPPDASTVELPPMTSTASFIVAVDMLS